MRLRASRRHEQLQSAASALGQGAHADGKKNPSQDFQVRRSVARQGRSLFPSHREYQLPAHGPAFHDASAGHDRAVPAGLVPDAAHRLTAFSRFHVLDFELLSRRAKGASAQNLVAYFPIFAVCHGHGHRHFRPQRTSRD